MVQVVVVPRHDHRRQAGQLAGLDHVHGAATRARNVGSFKRQPVAVGDGIHEGQLARLGLLAADGRRPVQWQRGRRRAAVRPRRQDVQFGSARQPGQLRRGAAVDGGCGGGRSVGDCRRAEQEFVQLGSRYLLDLLVRLLVVVLVGLTG